MCKQNAGKSDDVNFRKKIYYGQTDVSNIPALLKGKGIDVRIRHYE